MMVLSMLLTDYDWINLQFIQSFVHIFGTHRLREF